MPDAKCQKPNAQLVNSRIRKIPRHPEAGSAGGQFVQKLAFVVAYLRRSTFKYLRHPEAGSAGGQFVQKLVFVVAYLQPSTFWHLRHPERSAAKPKDLLRSTIQLRRYHTKTHRQNRRGDL